VVVGATLDLGGLTAVPRGAVSDEPQAVPPQPGTCLQHQPKKIAATALIVRPVTNRSKISSAWDGLWRT